MELYLNDEKAKVVFDLPCTSPKDYFYFGSRKVVGELTLLLVKGLECRDAG